MGLRASIHGRRHICSQIYCWTVQVREFLLRINLNDSFYLEIVQGKSVLEIGCGVGFLGILIAQLQSSELSNESKTCYNQGKMSLWLTDFNADILSQCKENLSISCSTWCSMEGSRLITLFNRQNTAPSKCQFLSTRLVWSVGVYQFGAHKDFSQRNGSRYHHWSRTR